MRRGFMHFVTLTNYYEKKTLTYQLQFFPEPTGIGKYNGEMIDWFVRQGYDCTVITSYPYYPYWKVQEPYFKRRFWYTTEVAKIVKVGRQIKDDTMPTICSSKTFRPEKSFVGDFIFFFGNLPAAWVASREESSIM